MRRILSDWHYVSYIATLSVLLIIHVLHLVFGDRVKWVERCLDPQKIAIIAILFLATLVSRIEALHQEDQDAIAQVNRRVTDVTLARFRDETISDDALLHKVFQPMFGEMATNVELLRKHTLVFRYPSSFPEYYQRALDALPGHQFCAISLPWATHVWGDDGSDRIFAAMRRLTDQRGQIERVFLVKDPAVPTDDEKCVINDHPAAGVKVFLFPRANVIGQERYILVDRDSTFGWEAWTGFGERLARVQASTDSVATHDWLTYCDHILEDARQNKVAAPFNLDCMRVRQRRASVAQ